MQPDIIKIAAAVIDPKGRLLVVRRKGSTTWISLGGKPESNESAIETLTRKLQEEIQCQIDAVPVLIHVSPIEPAAGKQNQTVQISTYIVSILGEPRINASDGIEEFHWLTKAEFESDQLELGSVLQKFVVPQLIAAGMMK